MKILNKIDYEIETIKKLLKEKEIELNIYIESCISNKIEYLRDEDDSQDLLEELQNITTYDINCYNEYIGIDYYNETLDNLEKQIQLYKKNIQILLKTLETMKNININLDSLSDENYNIIHFDFVNIKKTNGGLNHYGISYLLYANVIAIIKQTEEEIQEEIVIAKISDHSKYNHNIQLYDYMDIETMKKIINMKDIKNEIEKELVLSHFNEEEMER